MSRRFLTSLLSWLAVTSVTDAVLAQASFQGPHPYRSAADSSYVDDLGEAYCFLEDFEDGAFNNPGVQALDPITLTPVGVLTRSGNPGLVDSVDGDDGNAADGACNADADHRCDSYFWDGNPGFLIVFDAEILGAAPDRVGVVWTDGAGTTTFEAFDLDGTSLGSLDGMFGDAVYNNTTADDTFFGVSNAEGISAVRIWNSPVIGGIEIDHLQWCLPPCADAASCDDGLGCTVDQCVGGVCVNDLASAGAECRPAAGACDVAELCDGASTDCPADGLVDPGEVCLSGIGECDPDDVCDGLSADCAPVFTDAGTTCTDSQPNDCQMAGCDGNGACDLAWQPEPDATTCDDGLFCTGLEGCQSGVCVSSGDPCSPEACDEEADDCLPPVDLDSDGDGIPDVGDACPAENPGDLDLNNDGCIDDEAALANTIDGLVEELVALAPDRLFFEGAALRRAILLLDGRPNRRPGAAEWLRRGDVLLALTAIQSATRALDRVSGEEADAVEQLLSEVARVLARQALDLGLDEPNADPVLLEWATAAFDRGIDASADSEWSTAVFWYRRAWILATVSLP